MLVLSTTYLLTKYRQHPCMEPQGSIHNHMKLKEFHSPILKRTVKPDEPDYLKHYKDALLFELKYLDKQKCSCSGCHYKRKGIEKDLMVIFNININSLIRDK